MATGVLLTPPIVQFFGNDGKPAVNGSVLTQVGAVNTATYQDVGLTVPLPNPIPLNSRGEISTSAGASTQCFLTPNVVYTFTLFDLSGNQLWVATYVNGSPIQSASIIPNANNTYTLGSPTFSWANVYVGANDSPVLDTVSGNIGYYARTTAEIAAGVVPVNYAYVSGDLRRYANNTVPGTTDMSGALITANLIGCEILATGTQVYALSASVIVTNPLFIDAGSTFTVNSSFNLTINGHLRIDSATPFLGNGGVNFSTLSRPGRVENVLPDRAAGVPVYGSGFYDAFGDSYTAGTGATAATCYAGILSSRFNTVFNNRGVSGTGVTKTMTQAFSLLPSYHMRGRFITWMAGFNDLFFYGNNATTMTKIGDVCRAFIANAFLKTAVPANDASVTQTGAWTTVTPGTWGDKASNLTAGTGRAVFFGTSTGRLDWTFTGESVVVGTWNGNGSTYAQGQFDVYIDSVFVETRTPLGASDGNLLLPDTYQGLSHTALVYTGLGSGSHTISVRLKTNNISMFDYFGTLAPPSECPSLLMGDISFLNAAGYVAETLRSKTIDSLGSSQIQTQVALFSALGYPVASVPCNDYYNANTQAFSDNIHPSPAGHIAFSQAFASRAQAAPITSIPSCTLTKSATQAIVTSTSTAITWSAVANDNWGFWAVGLPSRIVAPFGGVIRLSGSYSYAANATGLRTLELHVNGSGALSRVMSTYQGFVNGDNIFSFSVDIALNVGDYVEIWAIQNSGGNLNIQTQTFCDVAMIR